MPWRWISRILLMNKKNMPKYQEIETTELADIYISLLITTGICVGKCQDHKMCCIACMIIILVKMVHVYL